jgi:sugar phosphate isomerase/epimerase
VETHDHWCDPDDLAAVLRRVNHPAVAANWDIMHPVRAARKTIDQAFQTLQPWIRHLHVHDGGIPEPCVLKPIGQGEIDHRRALELLLQSGYAGYISGEWIDWEPWATHLPRELVTLKRYEQEIQAG